MPDPIATEVPLLLVEVEPARTTATLVDGGGVRRGEVAAGGSPAVAALAALCPPAPPARLAVCVLLGDPRVVTARVRAERRPASLERAAVAAERIREVGMLPPGDDLRAVAADQRADAGWDAVAVGAPAALVAAFEAEPVPRQFVTSAEVGLAALATPERSEAVLDLRVDPARLVVVDHGRWVGARRFKLPLAMLGGGKGPMAGIEGLDPSGMVGAEIARALRQLAGPDGPSAERVVVLGAPSALRDRREELAAAAGVGSVVHVDDGTDGAAQAALARALAVSLDPAARPFVIAPAPVDRWARLRRVAPRAAGIAAGIVGLALLGHAALGAPAERRAAMVSEGARARRLAQAVAERREALARPPIVADREAILATLRRPEQSVSRLLARIAVACGSDVGLDSIELTGAGRLTLRGVVRGDARLGAFAVLDGQLAGVAGLGAGEGGVGASGAIDAGAEADRRLFYRASLERRLP